MYLFLWFQIDSDYGGKSSISVLELRPTVADNGEIYACNAENELIERAVSDAVTLNILCKFLYIHVCSMDCLGDDIISLTIEHTSSSN